MNNTDDTEFNGWAIYPRNLPLSLVEVDTYDYDLQLSNAAGTLFAENEVCDAKSLRFDPVGTDGTRNVDDNNICSIAQLEKHFRNPQSSQIFFLHQNYSWGCLQISEGFLRRLFTRLQVHPDFLQILFLFHKKAGPVEESFSSFFSHYRPLSQEDPFLGLSCSYDIGYNLKYAARHGRPRPKDPFVIRETGIYQSFNAETRESHWVIVQGSKPLQERMKNVFTNPEEVDESHQFKLHGLILQVASQGWRDYLLYLEEEFSKVVEKGFFTNADGPLMEGDFEVDFSDVRKLHILVDKLQRMLHLIHLNMETAEQIKSTIRRLQKTSGPHLCRESEATETAIDMSISQHRTHGSRLRALIDRAQGIGKLVQSLLDIRTAEGSKKINTRMHDLAEQSAEENKLIRTLTFQSTQETKSMSIITLISAVFLPSTFLATLFGTNFFSYENGNLEVAANFWIYIVIVVAVSGATVLIWIRWARRIRASAKESDIEAAHKKV